MDSNKKIHARNGVSKQDSKKDTTGNPRQWPKNARRRESNNAKSSQEHQLRNNSGGTNNNASNNGQQFRHNSERRSKWNRNGAARPAYLSGEATGLAGEEDEDDDLFLETAELNSVLVPGSKKHNLNHLLNFHYAPRERDIGGTRSGSAVAAASKRELRGGKANTPLYNKDQFLQANCNFIVKQSGDYKAHLNDPDTLVDWKWIEEVVIRSSEEPQCPICLFPPVAAKMTKCGHVYCWPCILHYLALSDKEWRKCPICYDAVNIKDLRSTVSWPYHEYQLNETVDFQLMCRRKGCLDVVKVGQQQQEDEVGNKFPHLFDVREQQIVHSKLILANTVEVTSILDRERCELQEQMKTDGPEGLNCPEIMFISQAMDLLEERAKEVQVEREKEATGGGECENEKFCLFDDLPVTVGELDAEDYYYFYQAVDGQHLYMHSINLRMLQVQFGSLATCPIVLTGRIVQREHCSVSDALRKRSKYLQHLPLTSIVTFVEVQFPEDFFSAEVKEQFAEEVNQRKRDRQRRARDEKKREKHINELNDVQMGKMMSQHAGFVREEQDYYPFLTTDVVDAAGLEGASGTSEPSFSVGSPNTPFSFAKMLQSTSEIERAQPALWPTLDNKKPAAWGAPALDASSGNQKASRMDKHFPNLLDTIDIEEEELWPGEDASSSPRMPCKASVATKGAAGPKGNNAPSKRASKKKQQLLLFSTDMNFNRN